MMQKIGTKELREAVVRQLDWTPEINSQDIGVSVTEGVVTLTGFVHSFAEKVAAERAAKSVYGVKAVANDIEVKAMTRSDPEVARDIVHALRLDVVVPDERIKTGVQNGFVTLGNNRLAFSARRGRRRRKEGERRPRRHESH